LIDNENSNIFLSGVVGNQGDKDVADLLANKRSWNLPDGQHFSGSGILSCDVASGNREAMLETLNFTLLPSAGLSCSLGRYSLPK